MEKAKDFWALHGRDPMANWPKSPDGTPEEPAKLTQQSELDSMADITISMLDSYGIPAFKVGSVGKVIMGFAGLGVEIYVPVSRLAEAESLLCAESDSDSE